MTRFFDTSALAKRYMSEPGTPMVRATLRAHAVVVARVTFAELAASVARAARMAVITAAQRDAILARVTLDFSRLQIVELRASMLAGIPELRDGDHAAGRLPLLPARLQHRARRGGHQRAARDALDGALRSARACSLRHAHVGDASDPRGGDPEAGPRPPGRAPRSGRFEARRGLGRRSNRHNVRRFA